MSGAGGCLNEAVYLTTSNSLSCLYFGLDRLTESNKLRMLCKRVAICAEGEHIVDYQCSDETVLSLRHSSLEATFRYHEWTFQCPPFCRTSTVIAVELWAICRRSIIEKLSVVAYAIL